MVRRASCGLQRPTSAACHAAQSRWRSLSLGRKRMRKLAVRARCAALFLVWLRPIKVRWTGERPVSFGPRSWCDVPGLRRRETCLLRRALVERRASCGLQRGTSAACHAEQLCWRSLSLGRKRMRKLAVRARCAAPVVVWLRPIKVRWTGERPVSFGPRSWCDVPGLRRRETCLLRRALVERRASCGLQRGTSAACHAAKLCWRSLSLGRKHTRKLAVRERCAALSVA